jgi:hypothetical protein
MEREHAECGQSSDAVDRVAVLRGLGRDDHTQDAGW